MLSTVKKFKFATLSSPSVVQPVVLTGILSKEKNGSRQNMEGDHVASKEGKSNVSVLENLACDSRDDVDTFRRERDRSLSPGSTKRST